MKERELRPKGGGGNEEKLRVLGKASWRVSPPRVSDILL